MDRERLEGLRQSVSLRAGGRVRVVDPADRRKRVDGTVVRIDEGRGAWTALVLLDDETHPMAFDMDEIARVLSYGPSDR